MAHGKSEAIVSSLLSLKDVDRLKNEQQEKGYQLFIKKFSTRNWRRNEKNS